MEDGSWKTEVGSWKTEVGRWKLEDGSWKLEVGRWKLEDGGSYVKVEFNLFKATKHGQKCSMLKQHVQQPCQEPNKH